MVQLHEGRPMGVQRRSGKHIDEVKRFGGCGSFQIQMRIPGLSVKHLNSTPLPAIEIIDPVVQIVSEEMGSFLDLTLLWSIVAV